MVEDLIDTINGPQNAGTAYKDAPSWIKNWQKTGLIKWEDDPQPGWDDTESGDLVDELYAAVSRDPRTSRSGPGA